MERILFIAYPIATCYWLAHAGIESQCGKDFFAAMQTSLGANPSSCTMVTGHSWWYSGWGAALTTRLHLAPRLKRLQQYLYSSSVPSCQVIGLILPLPFCFIVLTTYPTMQRHNPKTTT